MSNGWIPMPLSALAFALQLANHEEERIEHELEREIETLVYERYMPADFILLTKRVDESKRAMSLPAGC